MAITPVGIPEVTKIFGNGSMYQLFIRFTHEIPPGIVLFVLSRRASNGTRA
jgi:hypothetical protein